MTRGQESLSIDVQDSGVAAYDAKWGDGRIDLVVLPASPEELEAHERQLDEIAQAAKGACVWRLPPD